MLPYHAAEESRRTGSAWLLEAAPGLRWQVQASISGLLLRAERGLGVSVRKQAVGRYVIERDPVAGVVSFISPAVFLLMPVLVRRASE